MDKIKMDIKSIKVVLITGFLGMVGGFLLEKIGFALCSIGLGWIFLLIGCLFLFVLSWVIQSDKPLHRTP